MLRPTRDQWLQEASPSGPRCARDDAVGGEEQNPDRTMDCVGSVCGDTSSTRTATPAGCSSSTSPSVIGDSTVKTVLDISRRQSAALSGTQALSAVVPATGTTLGKFFEDYTTARLTGNFTSELLAGRAAADPGLDRRRARLERRDLPGDARGQPPCRSLSGPRARCRHRHRALLLGVTGAQGRAAAQASRRRPTTTRTRRARPPRRSRSQAAPPH